MTPFSGPDLSWTPSPLDHALLQKSQITMRLHTRSVLSALRHHTISWKRWLLWFCHLFLFVLCFLILGGHCLQMLYLPGFGTHAKTPRICHIFVLSLLVSRSTLPQTANFFLWQTLNCQIVPVLPSQHRSSFGQLKFSGSLTKICKALAAILQLAAASANAPAFAIVRASGGPLCVLFCPTLATHTPPEGPGVEKIHSRSNA